MYFIQDQYDNYVSNDNQILIVREARLFKPYKWAVKKFINKKWAIIATCMSFSTAQTFALKQEKNINESH